VLVDFGADTSFAKSVESGGGLETELHCLGDGAKWIVGQMSKRFGEKAKYLVDVYHLSN
jgi:hypothetical protein